RRGGAECRYRPGAPARAGWEGSSAEETVQGSQVIDERRRADRERAPHDQCQCFTRLPVGPPRPHREARAERDRGRDEEAVKGEHTILSNTMSVSSAGR